MIGLLHLPWAMEFVHLVNETHEIHELNDESAVHFHEVCLDCELFDCIPTLPYTVDVFAYKDALTYGKLQPLQYSNFSVWICTNPTKFNGLRAPPAVSFLTV